MKANLKTINRYFKVSSQILKCHLSPMELGVYFAIASFVNKKNDTAIVRYCVIANRLNVSKRSVARAVKTLSEKGLICLTKRYTIDGYKLCYSFKLRTFVGGFKLCLPYDCFNLSPSALMIYSHLTAYSNKKSGFVAISLNQLSNRSELSLCTVINDLKELCNNGLINKRFYIKLDGGFGHNYYYILSALVVANNNDKHSVLELKIKKKVFEIEFSKSNRLDIASEFIYLKRLA